MSESEMSAIKMSPLVKMTVFSLGTAATIYIGSFIKKLLDKRSKQRKKAEKAKILAQELDLLNRRKPPEKWNTVLFFPDYFPEDPNSMTSKFISYFESAKISIQICIYLSSYTPIEEVILRKFRQGLIIQVITDHDTTIAHNNFNIKMYKKAGIPVRTKSTGFLMHHKFAIIDEEAVLTGSLNWTKQGITCNRENVVVTTDRRLVSKFTEQFVHLWKEFEESKY